MLNEDYREMLHILLKNRVDFLVVGAYAMGVHGYPRATGDLDIWIATSPENSENIYQSLKEFGAPLSELRKDTFCEKGIVFQIGIAPRRIDIITGIDGVEFENACKTKIDIEIEGIAIPVISKDDLIRNKEATGREKDMLDARYLKGTDSR